MISIGAVFWLMVSFFALIGALRGWTREVIATSGLVLSLFALNQFGPFLIDFLGFAGNETMTNAAGEVVPVARRQFYVFAAIHLTIAFFSYQGPAIAGRRLAERLRIRDNIQDKLLGMLIGGTNGYLIVGTLWAFLEYQIIAPGEWQKLAPGVQYPFDPSTLVRPALETTGVILNNLPLPLLAPYLPVLVVIVFLFVIIVMI